jgi:hypothetical protein
VVAAAATAAITLGVSGPGAVVGLGRGSATPTISQAPTITEEPTSTAASSSFNDSVPPTSGVPDLARSQLAVVEFFAALNRGDVDAALALVCTQSQNDFRNAAGNLTSGTWSVPHLIGHRTSGENLLLRYTIKRQSGSASRRLRLLITMISENLHPVICGITG